MSASKNPLGWTEDEEVLTKYPMLREVAKRIFATMKAKGVDPKSLGSADVEGQEVLDFMGCNQTNASHWGGSDPTR